MPNSNAIENIRRWAEEAWDRLLGIGFVRRGLLLLLGLGLSIYPIYVAWVLGLSRDFTVEAVIELVAWGVMWLATLLGFAAVLPSIDRHPGMSLLALVPVVGAFFLVWWAWALSDKYVSTGERLAVKQSLLEGLDDTDREVYRLRFDPDSDLHVSRRKAVRRLGISEERLRLAEGRIESRFEQAGQQ